MANNLQVNGGTKIGNAVIPPEGPLAIPLQMNFGANTAYSVDVGSIMQKGPGYPGMSVIQTLFVDNSAGVSATRVLITGTQQTIIVPAGAQGYFPILSPSTGQIVFSNNSMGVVSADIINVPMPALIWGGTAAAGPQYDGNGRLITTDPVLEALINDGALEVRGYDGPIPEAPEDGNIYGRKNGGWSEVQGGGGGGGFSPFNPADPVAPVAASFTVGNPSNIPNTGVSNLGSGRGVNFAIGATNGFEVATFGLNTFNPPAAGTDFSAIMQILCNSEMDANWHIGLYFQDVNGNQQSFGYRNNLYSIFEYGNGGQNTTTNTIQDIQGPWWLKVSRVGANIISYMCKDGESWNETFSVGATSFLAADITGVGFSMGWNNGQPNNISCFEFTTSEP